MAAGAMRHLFRLERRVKPPNDFGDGEAQWQPVAEIRGEWRPQKASEVVAREQVHGQMTSRIRFRATRGLVVKHTDRLIDLERDVTMNIVGTINVAGRNRYFEAEVIDRG